MDGENFNLQNLVHFWGINNKIKCGNRNDWYHSSLICDKPELTSLNEENDLTKLRD